MGVDPRIIALWTKKNRARAYPGLKHNLYSVWDSAAPLRGDAPTTRPPLSAQRLLSMERAVLRRGARWHAALPTATLATVFFEFAAARLTPSRRLLEALLPLVATRARAGAFSAREAIDAVDALSRLGLGGPPHDLVRLLIENFSARGGGGGTSHAESQLHRVVQAASSARPPVLDVGLAERAAATLRPEARLRRLALVAGYARDVLGRVRAAEALGVAGGGGLSPLLRRCRGEEDGTADGQRLEAHGRNSFGDAVALLGVLWDVCPPACRADVSGALVSLCVRRAAVLAPLGGALDAAVLLRRMEVEAAEAGAVPGGGGGGAAFVASAAPAYEVLGDVACLALGRSTAFAAPVALQVVSVAARKALPATASVSASGLARRLGAVAEGATAARGTGNGHASLLLPLLQGAGAKLVALYATPDAVTGAQSDGAPVVALPAHDSPLSKDVLHPSFTLVTEYTVQVDASAFLAELWRFAREERVGAAAAAAPPAYTPSPLRRYAVNAAVLHRDVQAMGNRIPAPDTIGDVAAASSVARGDGGGGGGGADAYSGEAARVATSVATTPLLVVLRTLEAAARLCGALARQPAGAFPSGGGGGRSLCAVHDGAACVLEAVARQGAARHPRGVPLTGLLCATVAAAARLHANAVRAAARTRSSDPAEEAAKLRFAAALRGLCSRLDTASMVLRTYEPAVSDLSVRQVSKFIESLTLVAGAPHWATVRVLLQRLREHHANLEEKQLLKESLNSFSERGPAFVSSPAAAAPPPPQAQTPAAAAAPAQAEDAAMASLRDAGVLGAEVAAAYSPPQSQSRPPQPQVPSKMGPEERKRDAAVAAAKRASMELFRATDAVRLGAAVERWGLQAEHAWVLDVRARAAGVAEDERRAGTGSVSPGSAGSVPSAKLLLQLLQATDKAAAAVPAVGRGLVDRFTALLEGDARSSEEGGAKSKDALEEVHKARVRMRHVADCAHRLHALGLASAATMHVVLRYLVRREDAWERRPARAAACAGAASLEGSDSLSPRRIQRLLRCFAESGMLEKGGKERADEWLQRRLWKVYLPVVSGDLRRSAGWERRVGLPCVLVDAADKSGTGGRLHVKLVEHAASTLLTECNVAAARGGGGRDVDHRVCLSRTLPATGVRLRVRRGSATVHGATPGSEAALASAAAHAAVVLRPLLLIVVAAVRKLQTRPPALVAVHATAAAWVWTAAVSLLQRDHRPSAASAVLVADVEGRMGACATAMAALSALRGLYVPRYQACGATARGGGPQFPLQRHVGELVDALCGVVDAGTEFLSERELLRACYTLAVFSGPAVDSFFADAVQNVSRARARPLPKRRGDGASADGTAARPTPADHASALIGLHLRGGRQAASVPASFVDEHAGCMVAGVARLGRHKLHPLVYALDGFGYRDKVGGEEGGAAAAAAAAAVAAATPRRRELWVRLQRMLREGKFTRSHEESAQLLIERALGPCVAGGRE